MQVQTHQKEILSLKKVCIKKNLHQKNLPTNKRPNQKKIPYRNIFSIKSRSNGKKAFLYKISTH